jgi:hypothetical protein
LTVRNISFFAWTNNSQINRTYKIPESVLHYLIYAHIHIHIHFSLNSILFFAYYDIGLDCKFLQGDITDQEKIAVFMSKLFGTGGYSDLKILNYHQDNTLLQNRYVYVHIFIYSIIINIQ